MHTTRGKSVSFIHNGDFSGDVEIVRPGKAVKVLVPFDDIKTLVAEYVRRQKTEKLEQASDDYVLLGKELSYGP